MMRSWLLLLLASAHGWISSSSSPPPCLQTSLLVSQNASLDDVARAQTSINRALVAFLAQSSVQTRVQWTNVDITIATIDGKGPAIVQMCLYVPSATTLDQVAAGMSATRIWSGLNTSLGTLHRRFQLLDQTTPLQMLSQVTERSLQRISIPFVQWYVVVQGRFESFWPQMKIKHAMALLLNVSSSNVIPQDIFLPPYEVYNQIATIMPFAITQINASTFTNTANALTEPLKTALASNGIILISQFPDPNGNGKLPQSNVPWPEYPQLDLTSFYPFHNSTPVPNSFIVKLDYNGLLTLTNVSSVISQVLQVLDSAQIANFTAFQTLSLTNPPSNSSAPFNSSLYNTLDFVVAGDRSTLEANEQALGQSLNESGVSIIAVIDINLDVLEAQWYPYFQLVCPYTPSTLSSTIQRIALAFFFSIPFSSVQLIEIGTSSTTFEIACNDTLELRYLKKQLKETTRWAAVMNNFAVNPALCTVASASLAYPPFFPGSNYGWSQPTLSMDNVCTTSSMNHTACDQCQRYLNAYCFSSPDCYQVQTTLLPQLLASSNASNVFQQLSLSTATTKTVNTLALYYSCIAAFQCLLAPNTSITTDTEVYTISVNPNTTKFATTLYYPQADIFLDLSEQTTPQEIQANLSSAISNSIAIKVIGNGSLFTVAMGSLIVPLPLPIIVHSTAPATIQKISASSPQLVSLSESSNANAVLLNSACTNCMALIEQCAISSSCKSIVNCWSSAVESAMVHLKSVYSTIEISDQLAACYSNASLADIEMFLPMQKCLLQSNCPIEPTLESIVQGTMSVLRSTAGLEVIEIPSTLAVTMTLGAESIILSSSNISDLEAAIADILAPLCSVSIQSNNTTFSIQLRDFGAPILPIFNDSMYSQAPRIFLDRMPLDSSRFGFPYQSYNQIAPLTSRNAFTTTLNGNCQPCQNLFIECLSSPFCASAISNFQNTIAGATTAFIGQSIALPSLTFVTPEWDQFAQTLSCFEIHNCPINSTISMLENGRMLLVSSTPVVLSVAFSTVPFEAVINMNGFRQPILVSSNSSAADIQEQFQMNFGSLALSNVSMTNNSLMLSLSAYYGPTPEFIVTSSELSNKTIVLGTAMVNVVSYSPAAYFPN